MAIPVYMFLGFLESGKTTLIQETLNDEGFNEGEKTLLLVLEDGIEEYSRSFLEKTNTIVEYFEDLSEINEDILQELDRRYEPDRIMIEFNGTWNIDDFLDIKMPLDWVVVQILSTIDASTFTNYINNMRTFMFNIMNPADVVVFNYTNFYPAVKKNLLLELKSSGNINYQDSSCKKNPYKAILRIVTENIT